MQKSSNLAADTEGRIRISANYSLPIGSRRDLKILKILKSHMRTWVRFRPGVGGRRPSHAITNGNIGSSTSEKCGFSFKYLC